MRVTFFIFLFILSCGKRDLENQIANPFLGNWKLEKVSCYVNDYDLLEEYIIPSTAEINLNYIKGTFSYQIESTAGSGYCSMNVLGDYFYSVTSFNNGKVSFYTTNSPTTCSLLLEETLSTATVTIPLYPNSVEVKNLSWRYDLEERRLIIPGPFTFTGATTIGEGCAGSCLCLGYYSKISSDT